LKASFAKARKRTKVVVYQPQQIETMCRNIVVATRNALQTLFQSRPQSLDREKKIKFFSKPHDTMSSSQTIMREIWTRCPDVTLPAFLDADVDSFVDNLVWPFALNYASELHPIMKPFLDVQTYLISEANGDDTLQHLEKFSSSFQPNENWLFRIINRCGVASEVDGVSTYQEVFESVSVENWSDPEFRFGRILNFVNRLETSPIIFGDNGTNFPWFFALGVTWGEFRDRLQQCANMRVDVEGLSSFICETRTSWIPLFDPLRSTLNASTTLAVPEKSFITRLTATAQEKTGDEEREGERELAENARRATGGDEGEGNGFGGSGGGGEAGAGQKGGGEAGAGQKDVDGTKSEVPFSATLENSSVAEKASDEAGSKHRLADVFPLTVGGDSVVNAHAPH